MIALRREYGITACAVAVFACVYIALDFNKLYALRYGADLGTYLQTAVNLAHGSSWNGAEWRPHFEVHDSWLLTALVPVVALFPYAQTLLVVQVLALALAAFPLARFAREAGNAPHTAQALSVAYLLSPVTQGVAYDDFAENVFVPLLAFGGAIYARRRALLPTLLVAQLLLGVKEDEAFFIAWFGGACLLLWDRRMGIALFALALLNGVLFAAAEHLAGVRNSVPAYGFAVHDLSGKISLAIYLLAPFAFASLAIGWRFLLIAPLYAEILFAGPWAYEMSRVGSHYGTPLLAFVALTAALGLLTRTQLSRAMLPLACIAGVFFNDTVVKPGRWPYVVDWAKYAAAVHLRDSGAPALLPRDDEGVWAVAAANPRVRLARGALTVACPAYDTNAAQFFTSIGLAHAPPVRLCGGVPITP